MNELLFGALQIVAIAVITAVARYLIPFLVQLLRAHNYNTAADIVETLVRAAEQTITGSGRGSDRYEQVMQGAQEILSQYHIRMTAEQIDRLIEAAVQVINQETIRIESEPEDWNNAE